VAVGQREGEELSWGVGERLYQYILVPTGWSTPVLVDELDETSRGTGGFGSTGV
jgi:dUTPase